jgi:hypothetical protein
MVRYSAKLAKDICDRLAQGESLRAICRGKGKPSAGSVIGWVTNNTQGFAEQYARAREVGYRLLAEELLYIADTPKLGKKRVTKPVTRKDKDGNIVDTGEVFVEITEGDMIEHRRLQVDTRKWMLSKMLPKVYGDKQQIEHSGAIDIASVLVAARKRSGKPG